MTTTSTPSKTAVTWSSDTQGVPLPPRAPGLPILGNALNMFGDMTDFLVRMHQKLGPIYRLQAARKQYTVLAGIGCNQFITRGGEEFLSSEKLFGGYAEEMQAHNFLTALDGAPHRHMRKLLRQGYSKEFITSRLPMIIDVAEHTARAWQPGEVVSVIDTMQRMVYDQLGTMIFNYAPQEYFDDYFTFMSSIMRASVMKTSPASLLKSPKYLQARERIFQMARTIIAERRATPDANRAPDILDAVLGAEDVNGQPFDEYDLIAVVIGPYVAGMDTITNTLSFMLYLVLKHPDVLKQIQTEVDAAFVAGPLEVRQLKDMKTLYGASIETLRMYPIAPIVPRIAAKPFTFAGYRVDEGTEVWVGSAITHFLPEYFPDPHRFDVERYSEPRNEHRQTNAFAPYSLGAHTCLGAGMAEIQLMTTMATLLHTVEFETLAPDHKINMRTVPTPNPGRDFKIKVRKQRG